MPSLKEILGEGISDKQSPRAAGFQQVLTVFWDRRASHPVSSESQGALSSCGHRMCHRKGEMENGGGGDQAALSRKLEPYNVVSGFIFTKKREIGNMDIFLTRGMEPKGWDILGGTV